MAAFLDGSGAHLQARRVGADGESTFANAADMASRYSMAWNALLGPLPSAEPAGLITTPHDNSRRLAAACDFGPLTVRAGDRAFVEYRRLDPMSLGGWTQFRSWPVIVEGVHAGVDETAATFAATRDLHRLTCVLSLVWNEAWQVRTAPQASSRLPATVPDSDPPPPDWGHPEHFPDPEDVPLPTWVEASWDLLAADRVLAAALTSWHQGILLQATHPCFALVAYLGCIEAMARSQWVTSELERRALTPETRSEPRFRQTAALVATDEQMVLFSEMRAFGLRSQSAHGAPIVGIETSYGATIPLSMAQHRQADGSIAVSIDIDTTDPGHAFMIKLVPTARRVSSLLLHTALGAI